MTFTSQITTTPIPFDAERGRDADALFQDLPAGFRALIAGTAGSSSYLSGSIHAEHAWLHEVAHMPAEQAFAACLAAACGDTQAALGASLRRMKRRAALLIALADLGGVWSLQQVTGALTRLADHAVQTAISHLVAAETARGKLPAGRAPDAGLVVIAMGKMGAAELNYSSDIDLIVLFDESAYDPDAYSEVRSVLIRVTQRMVRLLSEVTGDGYVFRTDLRLRPDPSVTPVCIGMDAAERYYESFGRTWERAAMIKARSCAGDIAAGERFLQGLTPFIWRRYLDFTAIQDAHDMRQRIRSHKGLGGTMTVPGHHVKLGRGGIREIEFFAQTRQLICGGRDPDLRSRETLPALKALADKGWVKEETQKVLHSDYIAHRTLEHRIQMLEDAQTHIIPDQPDRFARLAALCGESDLTAFRQMLHDRFERVHALTEDFFAPDTPVPSRSGDLWAGFSNPESARALAEGWQNLPALRSDRARTIFTRLEPQLAQRLETALSPDEAIAQFDAFLRGLPAGVQVFAMFDANPQLLDLLVDICATAPQLAQYLGRNAGVLDSVIGQDFFKPLPDVAVLTGKLSDLLNGIEDYELALDEARRWVKEYRFRIGVHLLRQISEPEEAAAAYSDLAEAALSALYPVVVAHFAKRYGPPPGKGAAIIAMGKLGSREMTATSDLDLIMVYDAAGEEGSIGKRSLPTSTYYSKLTQALVSAISAPTAEGTLYKVDMRLRPSGRQGPVATSLTGFEEYQLREAWTWEHMALTRARVVAGVAEIAKRAETVINTVLTSPHTPEKVLSDAREMRARIADANPNAGADPWGVKIGPGRMLDIEMLAQAGMLAHAQAGTRSPRRMIQRLRTLGWISRDQVSVFLDSLSLLYTLQQIGRIAVEDGFAPDTAGRGLQDLVLHATGSETIAALEERLQSLSTAAAGHIGELLSGAAPEPAA